MNAPRPTRVRFRVVGWLTLAAALAYLCRNAVGVAESTIREEMGLSLRQSGWFLGAFFWTYALFQVPGGWLAHRQGARRAMALFAAAWSLGTLATGLAPAFWLLLAAQLVMGAAQAGIFPASCDSIARWIPLSRRSFACAVLCTGMQLGAIAAGFLTGHLLGSAGWRATLALYAVPGLLWAWWFFLRFRDLPRQDPAVNAGELALIKEGREDAGAPGDEETPAPTPWRAFARNPALWFLCGQQVCRAAGYMFFASWFPTFLQETRGISVKDSGYLQALVFGGTLAGSLLGGALADAIWRRTGSARLSRSALGSACLAACALLIFAAWQVASPGLAVALLAAGALFASLAGPPAFSAVIDIGGRHVPQAFGVMNMAGNLAAAATPVLVGYLFDWTANWDLVLLVFAAVYLAGAACWAMVDPERRVAG